MSKLLRNINLLTNPNYIRVVRVGDDLVAYLRNIKNVAGALETLVIPVDPQIIMMAHTFENLISGESHTRAMGKQDFKKTWRDVYATYAYDMSFYTGVTTGILNLN